MFRLKSLVAMVGAGLLIVSCNRETVSLPSSVDALEGHPMPALSFKTIDGNQVSFDALRGNVLLVDCWATWCPPCIASLPHLQQMATDSARAGKGLKVLALNNAEDPADVSAFLKQNNYSFTTPLASQEDLQKLMIDGIPAVFVVGRDGKVLKTFAGYAGDASDREEEKAVDDALAAK